jgi:predicted ATPase
MLDRSLEDALPYFFSLLGIVEGDDSLAQIDGQIKRQRMLDAIKRILLRESLNQPLMVIFEDLHWIDEQTQELLNVLADSIATAKILVLINYRPEHSHQWSSKTYPNCVSTPSARKARKRCSRCCWATARICFRSSALIIEGTEGTPFLIEEIVQALFEDGVLHRNGTMKLAKPMNAFKVPATVQAVLAARIDRLRHDEKELLQTLALLGREFPIRLLRRVVLNSDTSWNACFHSCRLASSSTSNRRQAMSNTFSSMR